MVLRPSPHSTQHSHAPGAGVTLQVDALPQKTSTPRLPLLVDTPPTSLHPGCACACMRCRASQAWRGGRDRPESQGPPLGQEEPQRSRTRPQTLLGAEAAGVAEEACGASGGRWRPHPPWKELLKWWQHGAACRWAAVSTRSRPRPAQRCPGNLGTEPSVVAE